MRCLTRVLSGAIPIVLVLSAVPAAATTLGLTATDAGFVTEEGGSAKGDGTVSPADYNYSVGREEHFVDGALGSPIAYMARKNYLVFDLSAVTGPITSATLEIFMGPDTAPPFPDGAHGYESLDPTESFELLEITDPGMALGLIGDLAFFNSSVGASAFDEPSDPGVMAAKDLYPLLADGPLLMGGIVVSSSDDGTTLSIPITPGGLGYLDMFAGGLVALAGVLPSAPPPPPADTESQLIFGFTGPDIPGGDPLTPVLEVTFVPEPGTATLLGLGLLGLGGLRKR